MQIKIEIYSTVNNLIIMDEFDDVYYDKTVKIIKNK